jgi:hypothetical protein
VANLKRIGGHPSTEPKTETAAALLLAMSVEAMSLNLPEIEGGHVNKMPFSGILVRLDVASDKPPNGTNGKRIILTMAAAEQALPSLLGMGVDLTQDLRGHDARSKIGIISSARIADGAVLIEGYIFCNDHPAEALAIQRNKADLGFSFEAANISVRSMSEDPLTITGLQFSGAAILMRGAAAYKTTALAASKSEEFDMDDITKAVTAALESALGPISKTLGEVQASQVALTAAHATQATAIEELRTTPPVAPAVAAAIAKTAPHVSAIEAAAMQMEKDGVCSAAQVASLRRLAAGMKADAAVGRMPQDHDISSYVAAAAAPLQPVAAAVRVEDTAEFKAMKAAFEAQAALSIKASQDANASLETKLADLTAKVTGMRPPPERKTLEPSIAAILAKTGLAQDEQGGQISIGKIDAALSAMPNMDTQQRLLFKTALARAGVVAN